MIKDVERKSPPIGQHTYNTRSKYLIGSTRASSSNRAKVNNTPQPIKQSIQNIPKLDLQYDIIEYLKKLCANIIMYDLLHI